MHVMRLRYARCEVALYLSEGLKAIFSAVLYLLTLQCLLSPSSTVRFFIVDLLFLVTLWIVLTAILAISHIVSYSS